jgi:5-methylcytosine-specific restriction endonuclease McrA
MQRVFVLDKNKEPLAPCHPARARQLLKKGRAAVYRMAPFTIILKEREGGHIQDTELKIDPGSRETGMALVQHNRRGKRVVWAANLQHRGLAVKNGLLKRRQVRRGRRNRKTRYRPPRFDNRRRPSGWLPPSLQSRVGNVQTWTRRLISYAPVTAIAVETVRFDTQKLQNPELSGIAYQQGALFGYEVREYLLEKWGRNCVYCGVKDVPLEVEHIIPRSRGGSNRVSNLTIACPPCNREKGNQTAAEYGFPEIQAQAKRPLKDAAAVNATRYAIGRMLKAFGLPVSFWSGGRTKFNRIRHDYDKEHWADAACVGETGADVYIPPEMSPCFIKSVGRGRRQMCLMDRYGFPRTRPKRFKRVQGFQTGDWVQAIVPRGKKQGTHVGRVAIRATGNFRVGKVDGINWRYCRLLQRADGYEYAGAGGKRLKPKNAPPRLERAGVPRPKGCFL